MSIILNDIDSHAANLKNALAACEMMTYDCHQSPEPEMLGGLFAVLHQHAESLEAILERYRAVRQAELLAAKDR